jgi:hypothetical protein
MRLANLRPVLMPLAGATMCLALMPHPSAVGGATVAQFVARALDTADGKDAGPVEIVIRRWSTDADTETLRKTLVATSADRSMPAFQRPLPEAGVVLVRGVQALGARVRERRTLTVEFAREIATPTGRQIVIATDKRLGLGDPQPSSRLGISSDRLLGGRKATPMPQSRSAESADEPPLPEFTLLDIRIGRDGKGVGKTASAANVVYNTDKKIFEIKNYNAEPVRLAEVRPTDKP